MAVATPKIDEHYERIASQYDRFYEVLSQATAAFIIEHMPLTDDDQILDIGGGTGQVAMMINEELKLKKPIVCVDPSKEMLQVAQSRGNIETVHSSAEDFLSLQYEKYPLKKIIINGCIHHLDSDTVFSALAKNMSEDGMCIVTVYSIEPGFTIYKAFDQNKMNKLITTIKSHGLNAKEVRKAQEPRRMEKKDFFDAIRARATTYLEKLSDEELEKLATTLEKEFSDKEAVELQVSVVGAIITKN